jgi:hypothetical protein
MILSLQLIGSPLCRRYQNMRILALETAAQLGVDVRLEEINDTQRLSQSNPLDLPRLYVNRMLIASRNPPKSTVLTEQLYSTSDQT